MSYEIDNLHFERGDQLKASDLQTIVDEVRRPSAIARGGAGVDVRQGPRGEVQITGISPSSFVGVASGNISARTGTQWGSGSVARLSFDGVNEVATDATYPVLNPSKNTMTDGYGIDSGMRVFVIEDEDGHYIVFPLECA